LAAAKILGLSDPSLQVKIQAYQEKKRTEIEQADQELQKEY